MVDDEARGTPPESKSAETGPVTRESTREAGIASSIAAVPFKRRFFLPAVILGIAEIAFILYPLWASFDLSALPGDTVLRTALPVGIGACVVWLGAIGTWLLPLWSAVAARRRGERVDKELAARAYRITLKGPVRVLLLRTALWTGAAALTGMFFHVYESWPWQRVAELAAISAVLAYVVSCVRAVWWAQIMGEVRARLFAAGSPLRRFDDSHFRRFTLVAMIVAGGVLAAQVAFSKFFIKSISSQQFLQMETFFPIATLIGVSAWAVCAKVMTADLREYLAVSRGEKRENAPPAATIYKRAQALPYRLAMMTMMVWLAISIVGALVLRFHLGFEVDDTLIVAIGTLILAIAGAIYEQLWHRDVLRPLLAHLTQRYRVPVRNIAPSLSLRSKLLLWDPLESTCRHASLSIL